MPGADGEWLRFAFLPGQPFGLHNVERHVEDMEEAERVPPLARAFGGHKVWTRILSSASKPVNLIRISRLTRRPR